MLPKIGVGLNFTVSYIKHPLRSACFIRVLWRGRGVDVLERWRKSGAFPGPKLFRCDVSHRRPYLKKRGIEGSDCHHVEQLPRVAALLLLLDAELVALFTLGGNSIDFFSA